MSRRLLQPSLCLFAFFIASFLGIHGVRAQEPIHLSGTFSDEGVECPAVRGDDGELYTLVGDVSGFEPGERVELIGTPAELSFCMQGVMLDVQAIEDESVRGQQMLMTLTGEVLDGTAGIRNCLILKSSDGKLYGLVPEGPASSISPGPARVIARKRLTKGKRKRERDLPCGMEVDQTLDLVKVLEASL